MAQKYFFIAILCAKMSRVNKALGCKYKCHSQPSVICGSQNGIKYSLATYKVLQAALAIRGIGIRGFDYSR